MHGHPRWDDGGELDFRVLRGYYPVVTELNLAARIASPEQPIFWLQPSKCRDQAALDLLEVLVTGEFRGGNSLVEFTRCDIRVAAQASKSSRW